MTLGMGIGIDGDKTVTRPTCRAARGVAVTPKEVAPGVPMWKTVRYPMMTVGVGYALDKQHLLNSGGQGEVSFKDMHKTSSRKSEIWTELIARMERTLTKKIPSVGAEISRSR